MMSLKQKDPGSEGHPSTFQNVPPLDTSLRGVGAPVMSNITGGSRDVNAAIMQHHFADVSKMMSLKY